MHGSARKSISRSPSFDEVRSAAIGRGHEIILNVARQNELAAEGKHFNCPKCSFKKARISNAKNTPEKPTFGGCDSCGDKWKDVFAFVAAVNNSSPVDAKNEIAKYLGVFGGSNYQPREMPAAAQKSDQIPIADDGYSAHREILLTSPANESILSMFSHRKRPASVQSLLDIGVVAAKWQSSQHSKHKQSVIAIPICGHRDLSVCNYALYSLGSNGVRCRVQVDGQWADEYRAKQLAFSRSPGQDRSDRCGVFLSARHRQMILDGIPIAGLKCISTEGETDLAGLLSILPTDEPYIVWANSDGARSRNCADWYLPMLAKLKPTEHIIIRDCDEAGIKSARDWAKILSRYAPTKVVELPMPYTETKGADLRDWLNDGNGIVELELLFDESPIVAMQIDSVKPEQTNIDSQPGEEIPPVSKNDPSSERQSSIVTLRELVDAYDDLRPVRIAGILRDTESCNVIASPKLGKSYLVGGLALCVATGRNWLGRQTKQGNVLIVDNELHPQTMRKRLMDIAFGMQMDWSEASESLKLLSLRGNGCDILTLGTELSVIKPGEFGLIILDALYRFLPEGTSESDNAQMTQIFNKIDAYANMLQSAFVIVHHSSKGDQSGKSITDVGSGAGSISRAVDSHLIIRPHETPGLAVLDAVTRSFPPIDPISIKWDYPCWHEVTVAPEVRRPMAKKEADQIASDLQSDRELIELLSGDSTRAWSLSQIWKTLGWGNARAARSVRRLLSDGRIIESSEIRKGQQVDVYSVVASTESRVSA
jgi:hypothetical protein